MFLRPDRVPEVIGDMHAHTLAGGCNLIVCAMDTATTPCPSAVEPGKTTAGNERWRPLTLAA